MPVPARALARSPAFAMRKGPRFTMSVSTHVKSSPENPGRFMSPVQRLDATEGRAHSAGRYVELELRDSVFELHRDEDRTAGRNGDPKGAIHPSGRPEALEQNPAG